MTLDSIFDHITKALQDFPGSHRYRVMVAASSPRQQKDVLYKSKKRRKTDEKIEDITISSHHLITLIEDDVLIYALEAIHYTSHRLLYISKVDTTGFHTSPSPAKIVTKAYIASMGPGMRVHVFARSQQAYLFPLSTKRILSDAALVRWWRSILATLERTSSYLIIPGLEESEALPHIGGHIPDNFVYGIPYNRDDDIMEIIPSFPDDPKSRFLDEIVSTIFTTCSPRNSKSKRTSDPKSIANSTSTKSIPTSSLTMKVGEFWDLMGHRQECAAGRVVGFLVVDVKENISHEEEKVSSTYNTISNILLLEIKTFEKLLNMLLDKDYSTLDRTRIATLKFIKATETIFKNSHPQNQEPINFWREIVVTNSDADKEKISQLFQSNVNILGVKRKSDPSNVNVLQPRKKLTPT